MPKTPPPTSTTPTVEGFLRTVLRSKLLDRDQLQTILRTLAVERRNEPESVAEHLIKSGRLTRFQVRKLLAGTARGLVLGPFHVLAPIARGGMGMVYLARDSRSEHLIALKVLPPNKAREEERLLARFRREMEMSQRVSHPHLAWTYEAGKWHDVYFIAMEYIPGKSLYRLVHDEGPLASPRAARLFAEVCLALDHAHNQGLIHRDLKPSNIMVTPNDHAKVLDLGLALMEGEAQGEREVIGGEGYVVGTMDYIAPEQTADPSKVDARCDVYALGCTLYFALTGCAPFPGGSVKEKIQRQRTAEPKPIPELNPTVPPGLVGVVRRMMAKDPEQRLPSAAAARHELLSWADKGSGLPLDQPEDGGYEQAVARLVAEEPSAGEVNAEVVPPGAAGAEEESPPTVEPISDAIPVGIPEPPAPPKPKRNSRVILDKPARPPRRPKPAPPPAASPPWLLYAVTVGVGVFLGLIVLVVMWLILKK